jgi:hypothetical protein
MAPPPPPPCVSLLVPTFTVRVTGMPGFPERSVALYVTV